MFSENVTMQEIISLNTQEQKRIMVLNRGHNIFLCAPLQRRTQKNVMTPYRLCYGVIVGSAVRVISSPTLRRERRIALARDRSCWTGKV